MNIDWNKLKRIVPCDGQVHRFDGMDVFHKPQTKITVEYIDVRVNGTAYRRITAPNKRGWFNPGEINWPHELVNTVDGI